MILRGEKLNWVHFWEGILLRRAWRMGRFRELSQGGQQGVGGSG